MVIGHKGSNAPLLNLIIDRPLVVVPYGAIKIGKTELGLFLNWLTRSRISFLIFFLDSGSFLSTYKLCKKLAKLEAIGSVATYFFETNETKGKWDPIYKMSNSVVWFIITIGVVNF